MGFSTRDTGQRYSSTVKNRAFLHYTPLNRGKLTVSNTLTEISGVYICYGIWYSSRRIPKAQKV